MVGLGRRLGAEAFGTFWLVFGGCGSAVLAAKFIDDGTQLGIGFVGVSLAFGLTVLTMVYGIGHISGCHLNPAVSIGLWIGRRFDGRDVLPYIGAQLVGAIVGAGVIVAIAGGRPGGIDLDAGGNPLATNGYGLLHSPGHFNLLAALIIEVVCTLAFVAVILGATDRRAPKHLAGVAIGLALTLIHLVSIPVTNTSVNPARSTGPALFVGGWAIGQLWLFWLAPIVGAVIAGVCYRLLSGEAAAEEEPEIEALTEAG